MSSSAFDLDRRPERVRQARHSAAEACSNPSASSTGWMDLYSFTEEPRFQVDFELANHYTSTHPSSSFAQFVTAQWPGVDRQLVLRGRRLTEYTPDGEEGVDIESDEELLEILRQRFGLDFAPGTVFRARLAPVGDS